MKTCRESSAAQTEEGKDARKGEDWEGLNKKVGRKATDHGRYKL